MSAWNKTEYLWAIVERLKQVQIECDDALKVIPRFDSPETLFYVDPPYLMSTRSERWQKNGYQHEMTDEQHAELADCLRAVEGMVIISAYRCDVYEALYPGWERRDVRTQNAASQSVTESLFLSPKVTERSHQQVMFGDAQ